MIVTISNLYGCGAGGIAQRAAEQLAYDVIDEQLPVVVANRLKTTPDAIEVSEHLGDSPGERILRALESGTPELRGAEPAVDFDAEILREVQEAVREYAARGNCFIIGRGAHAIFGRRADVVRVFMYAPRAWRVGRISDAFGVGERVAAAEVDRIDRARGAYMKAHYNEQWTDTQNYDVCIDVSHFGPELSALIIVNAVKPGD